MILNLSKFSPLADLVSHLWGWIENFLQNPQLDFFPPHIWKTNTSYHFAPPCNWLCLVPYYQIIWSTWDLKFIISGICYLFFINFISVGGLDYLLSSIEMQNSDLYTTPPSPNTEIIINWGIELACRDYGIKN